MEIAILALSAYSAIVLTAAGSYGVYRRRRKTPTPVYLQSIEAQDGKHYHHFDRTANKEQAAGYYCECGVRAPETKQPAVWCNAKGKCPVHPVKESVL